MARTVNFDFATAGIASEGRLTMAGTYMTTTGATINLPELRVTYLVAGHASFSNVIPTPAAADGWRYQVKLETTDGQAHWWIVSVSDLTTPVDFATLPVIEAISMPIDRTGTMIETWMNSVRAQATAANANALAALSLGNTNSAENGSTLDALNALSLNFTQVTGDLGDRLDQAELDLDAHDDRLTANDVDLDILKNTTLPALQGELDSTQADMSTLQNFTLVNLQNDLTATESSLDELTNLTLPVMLSLIQANEAGLDTLDTRLDAAEAEIVSSGAALDARIDQAFLDIDDTNTNVTAALTMAGSKNKVFYGTATPTPTNPTPSTVGDLYRKIDSSADVVMEYQWNGASWVDQAITSSAISNLDVGKLTAGTAFVSEAVIEKLWAEVITARKILASQLLIGSFDNLIENPSFEQAGVGWRDDGTGVGVFTDEPGARTGTWWLKATRPSAGNTTTWYHNQLIAVGAGETFKIGGHYKVIAGAGGIQFRMYEYGPSGNYLRSILGGADTVTADGWTRNEFSRQVSADARYIRIRVNVLSTVANTTVGVDDVFCNRMTDGSLIVNGSITGDHLEVNTVAAKIATVISLNADRITAGTVNTARLNASEIAAAVATIISLNADRITAGTINTARLNASEIAAAIATIIQLNADRITAGTINTARLNALEIAAATAAFQTVDVKNLFATSGTINTAVINKLYTDVVMSRLISTSMLAVGSFDNIIPNPNFEGGGSGWDNGTTGVNGQYVSYGTSGNLGYMEVASAASLRGAYCDWINVNPGDEYRFSARVNLPDQSTPVAGSIWPYVRWMNSAGTQTSVGLGPVSYPFASATASAAVSVNYTIPSGATKVRFGLWMQSSNVARTRFSQPQVTRVTDQTLIKDGAITTSKLVATAIDGMTITGPTIRTSSTAATTGIVMDSSGIEAKVSGTRQFFLNATTGLIEARGSITTGADSGARAVLSNRDGIGALDIYSGSGTAGHHAALATDTASVWLRRYTTASAFNQELALASTFTRLQHKSNTWLSFSDTDLELKHADSASAVLRSADLSGTKHFLSPMIDATTTTAAANININAGYIRRSTSASKYKLYPQVFGPELDDMLLSVQAKHWIDKAAAEELSEAMAPAYMGDLPVGEAAGTTPLGRIPGVIAEDVEAAGLTQFVVYGADGEIEGVMYDRLGVALIPVVKRQRDRIETLEDQMAQLLARVEQLEAGGL